MNKLIIEDDEGKTTVVPLVRDELTIGRKEGNAIRLTERNVSRRHARLLKQDGAICVEDLNSYTGVRVNGIRISELTPVRDGDQVQIGDYRLSVRSEGTAAFLPPTVPGLPVAVAQMAQFAPTATPLATTPAAVPLSPAPAALQLAPAGTPARAHLDAAPTIPLRTLIEQERGGDVAPTSAGRLVVVTTDLAGLEFKLDRPSLVVGRTEENDIILNHASISRHHAKVIRDGERYTIVDLQSANGVRVAGESYERVDVQPGDVIELGHVKLRFVGPWEDWTFDPLEFQVKSRRSLKIGAAVGGIILAGIFVVLLRGGKPPPPAPVVVVAPPPVAAGPSPAALLAEAKKAAQAENWEKAVSTIDLLLGRAAADPAAAAIRPGAAELKHKVDLERRSAEIFASFQQAVTAKEPDVALTRFDEIPAESVYKERATPALEDIKALFIAAHLELADAARTQGQCDEARAESEKILQVDPENRKAAEIVKKCRPRPAPRVAAAPAVEPRPVTHATATPPAIPHPVPRVAATPPAVPRPVVPRAPRPASPAAQPPSARASVAATTQAESSAQPDATDLIKQARDAWLHQQCGSAIDLSRRALKIKPGSNEANQIIAVCACSMRDRDGAVKAYGRLDDRNRTMVRSLCARNGVELPE